MRAVKGRLVKTKPVALSKASAVITRFAAADNGARLELSAHLRRAARAFAELAQLHDDLGIRHHQHRRRHQHLEDEKEYLIRGRVLASDGDLATTTVSTVSDVEFDHKSKEKKRKEKERLVIGVDEGKNVSSAFTAADAADTELIYDKRKEKKKKKKKTSDEDREENVAIGSNVSEENGIDQGKKDLEQESIGRVDSDVNENVKRKKRKRTDNVEFNDKVVENEIRSSLGRNRSSETNTDAYEGRGELVSENRNRKKEQGKEKEKNDPAERRENKRVREDEPKEKKKKRKDLIQEENVKFMKGGEEVDVRDRRNKKKEKRKEDKERDKSDSMGWKENGRVEEDELKEKWKRRKELDQEMKEAREVDGLPEGASDEGKGGEVKKNNKKYLDNADQGQGDGLEDGSNQKKKETRKLDAVD